MPVQPRFSILMPAYNRVDYIGETIACILAQDLASFELIIVDDGSTDGTSDVIADYAARDPRIRVHTQPNSGRPSTGRNIGIEMARGDHVTFIDSDDLHTPDRLASIDEALRRHGDGQVVFHNLGFVDAQGQTLPGTYLGNAAFTTVAGRHLRPLEADCYALRPTYWEFAALCYAGLHTCSVSVPRAVLLDHALRFDTRYKIVDDTDMWLRLTRLCPVLFIDRILGHYRLHPGGISKNPSRLLEESIMLHEHHLARLEPVIDDTFRRAYRAKIARYCAELGYARRVHKEFDAAAEAYAKALRLAPDVKTGMALVKTLCRLPVRA
ncbi:MAG: glycosyltransferase family 2 protein [Gammaproteobacteria bacterium]|nr:glycosyltransferase family 2 protein [Gammaproteobacteria bacterium]